MDQLPRLGKRELICLLLFTNNYVVSVCRDYLFLWVLRMGYLILLWHSLSLPYNYFVKAHISGERLQEHWSSGSNYKRVLKLSKIHGHIRIILRAMALLTVYYILVSHENAQAARSVNLNDY